jgi:hypothetical protein
VKGAKGKRGRRGPNSTKNIDEDDPSAHARHQQAKQRAQNPDTFRIAFYGGHFFPDRFRIVHSAKPKSSRHYLPLATIGAAGAKAGRDRDRSPRSRASEAGAAAAGAGATGEPFGQHKVGSAFVPLEGTGASGIGSGDGDPTANADECPMTQGIAFSSKAAATALTASRVATDAAAGAEAALWSDPAAKESHAAVAHAAAAMTSASYACVRAKAVQAMVTKASLLLRQRQRRPLTCPCGSVSGAKGCSGQGVHSRGGPVGAMTRCIPAQQLGFGGATPTATGCRWPRT